MYIERALENKIKSYLKRKEIIAIVGARQCGKTTMMKHMFSSLKNARFISFDDQKILQLFEGDIDLFIKSYIEDIDILFIDEFQYAEDGGKKLKYIYDSKPIKIIISGSSAAELSIQSIKYLVGRIFVFTLFPFSFEEFLHYKSPKLNAFMKEKKILSPPAVESTKKYYEEYLTFGGYPSVVLAQSTEEKIEILKNIYNTYLLREIREILQISEDTKLVKLMKLLALQIGKEVNYNELSLNTLFKYHELIKYLAILKKTFVCLESRPYFTNKRKELVKMPKLYFLDTGFRNMILDNFQEPEKRTDLGALNENFTASEITKKDLRLNYWRTKAGAEVDFILEKESRLIPIEVKTLLKQPKFGRSFVNFVEEYKPEEGMILSQDYSHNTKINKTKVMFRPVFMIPYLIELILKKKSK